MALLEPVSMTSISGTITPKRTVLLLPFGLDWESWLSFRGDRMGFLQRYWEIGEKGFGTREQVNGVGKGAAG